MQLENISEADTKTTFLRAPISYFRKLFNRYPKGVDYVAEHFGANQNKPLDSLANPSYNGGLVGTVGRADPIYPSAIGTVGSAPGVQEMFDIEKIAGTVPDANTSASMVNLAKQLRDMKIAHSLHASEFAKTLFASQDELGLTSSDVEKAIKAIINLRQSVNDNAQAAMAAVAKNLKMT